MHIDDSDIPITRYSATIPRTQTISRTLMFDLSCHPTYERAELAIDFLVVGGGVAGLSSALALRRAGHRVVVLEQLSEAELSKTSHGGVRLPPNVVKILFHWGLEESLREISVASGSIHMIKYETGEILGGHLWEEELLSEIGGEFLFCNYADLRRLLLNSAIKAGAKIHTSVKVTSVDSEGHHVTLSTGVTTRADVVVGADGCSSLIKQAIIGKDTLGAISSHSLFYNTTISTELMNRHPELRAIASSRDLLSMWLGHNATVAGFHAGCDDEFAFQFWVRPSQPIPRQTDLRNEMRWHMGHCEPKLLKMAELARPPTRTQVKNIPSLENWVHRNGRVLVIGDAAHPLPAGLLQGSALAVEDGAVLAKLFSHLRTEEQIPTLLHAFQELREDRCASVVHCEKENLAFLMMPHSQQQEQRDNMMRRRHFAGQSVLSDGGDTAEQWENIKELFGYDPEDQADDWWIKWGLLRERAKERFKDLNERMNARFNHIAPGEA